MQTQRRCPYCIEGKDFKAMNERLDGAWFECSKCGHVAMPEDDDFHCCCRNCGKQVPSIKPQRL